MNKELQTYYEQQFTLFASTGWKDLLEDLSQLRDTLADIKNIEDAKALHYRQGQLDILDLVITRKAACEKAYEDLQA